MTFGMKPGYLSTKAAKLRVGEHLKALCRELDISPLCEKVGVYDFVYYTMQQVEALEIAAKTYDPSINPLKIVGAREINKKQILRDTKIDTTVFTTGDDIMDRLNISSNKLYKLVDSVRMQPRKATISEKECYLFTPEQVKYLEELASK